MYVSDASGEQEQRTAPIPRNSLQRVQIVLGPCETPVYALFKILLRRPLVEWVAG